MYQTDLKETEWQFIKNELQIKDRKRKHDLREVFNALFYLTYQPYRSIIPSNVLCNSSGSNEVTNVIRVCLKSGKALK